MDISDFNSNKEFATELVVRFKLANAEAGINVNQAVWVHHRLRAIEVAQDETVLVIDLINLIVGGDIEVAYVALNHMVPDDMSQPYHWLSQERIDFLKSAIAEHLGL